MDARLNHQTTALDIGTLLIFDKKNYTIILTKLLDPRLHKKLIKYDQSTIHLRVSRSTGQIQLATIQIGLIPDRLQKKHLINYYYYHYSFIFTAICQLVN
jgi:hypothetical protein